jgi:hypothetical protein
MTDNISVSQLYISEASKSFRTYKTLGDKALAQLDEKDWHRQFNPESNSVAVIMQHLHGNMVSRFTNFLTADGEKPDRRRDAEFEDQGITPTELRQLWEIGWNQVFTTLDALQETDLIKTVYIRHEPFTVLGALQRQVAHYAYHVGQLVLLAKQYKKTAWQSLSIPRGQSETFNRQMQHQSDDKKQH